jgi:hypothetical protein
MTFCTAGYHNGMRQLLVIPIARSEFMNCPPPLGSPRFARGTDVCHFEQA